MRRSVADLDPPFTPTPGPRLRLASRDQPSPSIWAAIAGDPTLALSDHARRLVVADQQRGSRRVLLPVARIISFVVVTVIIWWKRVLPLAASWHAAIDWLSIRFIRRFVSEEGTELLLRHFVLETNLLAFIATNSGYRDVYRPDLRPTDPGELGESAVIEHDVNVLAVLGGLHGRRLPTPDQLDTSMLQIPPIDASTHRRWLRIDIETALYLMNIPFALFLTASEYRRAVHSLALDENLLECLCALTGIQRLRALTPCGSSLVLRTIGDVPRRVFIHAAIHEMANELLLRRAVAGPPGRTVPSREVPAAPAAVPDGASSSCRLEG